MKRGFLLLIFFTIILSSVVLAEARTTVYSGTLKDGEKAAAGDKEVEVFVQGLKALVKFDGMSFIIVNDGCRDQGNTEVCLNSVDNDYSASISIYRKVANVAVTKTVVNDGPISKEDAFTVNIDIENKDGGYNAENLVLIENFSDSFVFVDSAECKMENNVLKLLITLYKNDRIRCSYRLIPLEAGEFKLSTTINFFDGDKYQELKKETNVKVKEYGLIVVPPKFPKTTFDIGERIRFKFNLSNDFPYEVDIKSLRIKPKFFKIIEHDMADLGGEIGWEGIMKGNQSKSFSIEGEIQGFSNSLDFTIDYFGFNKRGISNPYLKFNVTKVEPELRFDKYNKAFRTDDPITLFFRNPTSKPVYNFFDLDIKIKSNILDNEQVERVSLLPSGEEKPIKLKKKENIAEGRYPLFITTNYKTSFGETVKSERTEFINVSNAKPEAKAEPIKPQATENISANLTSVSNETVKLLDYSSFVDKIKDNKLFVVIPVVVIVVMALFIVTMIYLRKNRNDKPQKNKMKVKLKYSKE